MSLKQVFLLSKAHTYDLQYFANYYDEELCLNVINENGEKIPLVSREMNPPTESKTMAMPGDDDPDPEDERCY